MRHINNLLLLAVIASITVGCGGGASAISDSNNIGSNGTSSGVITYGSTTLKWTAPITRADNSPVSLSDISGYRLYYGPSATNTPGYINILDGNATQYSVTLPSGTYFFRICAIDSKGFEGLATGALQKTL